MGHIEYQAFGRPKHQPVGYRFVTDLYDVFQVIYVTLGELNFKSEDQRMTLGPGGLALLRNRSVFALSCPRIPYRGVSFQAIGDFPSEFIGRAEAFQATSEIRMLAQLMEQQIDNPTTESDKVLEGLGRAMAWEAVRVSQQGARRPIPARSARDWADVARQTLDVTLYSARTAGEALTAVNLSHRQIRRHFTRAFGLSPKQYQLRARLDEAKRLLRETHLPITTIALELGYCSSQHFATQFLALAGQSPSAYRRTARRSAPRRPRH